jgi:hypothetical protein
MKIMKLLIVQISAVSYYFLPLGYKNSSQHPAHENPGFTVCSSLNVGNQVSHPYRTTCKTTGTASYVLKQDPQPFPDLGPHTPLIVDSLAAKL